MMETNNNWFNKQLFPGSDVLYPILSIVCLFIFFFFFGKGEEYTVLGEKVPNWLSWHIFAVFGFIFGSLWGIVKKWWNCRFLAIGTMIIFFSFFLLQKDLYHLSNDKIFLAVYAIFSSIYCLIKVFTSNLTNRFLWILPLLVIGTYYLFGNILLTILCCIITLAILAIFDTNNKLKSFATFGIVIFYVITSLTYFPYNPLLSNRNIKSIGISFHPRITSLVVEQDGKYVIVDGTSLNGRSPINVKFECWENITPYTSAFVGFKTDSYKGLESKSINKLQSILYPIIMSDSCVYFTSQMDFYKFLDNTIKSNDESNRLTASIFQDFLELLQNNDSRSLSTLKKHQVALQTEIEKLTIDSLVFDKKNVNSEKILKDFSRNLSLGMLNALCSDLIINNDINSALNIFSYQFFLTYYDSPIYNRINTSLNININKEYDSSSHSSSFHVTDEELKREDTFEPWVRMASMSISFAELYLSEIGSRNQTEILIKLKGMYDNFKLSAKNVFDKDITADMKKQMEDIFESLSSYKSTPTINQYASAVQQFLYQCILRDYLPDYNSFFLNRFNEITPTVPMNPESISAYENMSELYSTRFKQDIKGIIALRETMNATITGYDNIIAMQDSIDRQIQNLGLNPQFNSVIKEFLYKYTTKNKID